MIKLESAHIEEVRGIRKLDIDFLKGTFAISGPNGSGKSGVIDAIEFGLTGQIGRLSGRGTQGLSVSEHGPHVDKTKFPDAAFVELRVFLPAIGKSATITRKVASPRKPKIVPADDDVKAALAEIADHPEITLSRREILRFILVEPTKRSEEIQTILKLDEIGRKNKAAEIAWTSGKAAYEAYCSVMEEELNTLYDEVQDDFSKFYRAINEDDEAKFTAKLTPSEGRLDLAVNFYERGLFPPGAYHSEGHQDGMGVCLYLALMKRLFGDRFTFALLDDVVMSVDAGHRYQFCKLLKTHFPDTQFIITTHDRLWAEQMKSAGLVTAKTSIAFHSWTIDTGPLVESNQEIWDEIAAALGRGKVEAAAAGLRHHLEYVSRHLADQLGATPQFRADGNYELGELLPSVLARMKSLCGKAAEAARTGLALERSCPRASARSGTGGRAGKRFGRRPGVCPLPQGEGRSECGT